MLAVLDVLIVLGIIVLFIFWTRSKWKTIRPLIYEDSEKQEEDDSLKERQEGISEWLTKDKWKERFHSSLSQTLKKLGKTKIKEAQVTIEAIIKLKSILYQSLAEKIYDIIFKMAETGSLQSMLLHTDSAFIYILVFPSIHDQVTLIKKYKPFVHGLVYHIEELSKGLDIDKTKEDLIVIMLFLSPNLRDGTLHLAFKNIEFQLFPGNLLDNIEIKNIKGKVYESRQII